VKNYFRLIIKIPRLHDLTLLSIEREINRQFMDNPLAVIDEFVVMKKGRLEYLL